MTREERLVFIRERGEILQLDGRLVVVEEATENDEIEEVAVADEEPWMPPARRRRDG